ncbi:MAG: hypothetical protein WA584_14675 [Pyrinomonadaceae bacterium]
MADKKTRQMSPAELQEDLDIFAGLEGIAGYTPANDEYKLVNGTALKTMMQASEAMEIQKYNEWQAARDKKVTDQWAFHDYNRNAKTQVKAQFGENSDEVAATGMKKKSEYKSPKKKTPPKE